jgi:hypothetical protein
MMMMMMMMMPSFFFVSFFSSFHLLFFVSCFKDLKNRLQNTPAPRPDWEACLHNAFAHLKHIQALFSSSTVPQTSLSLGDYPPILNKSSIEILVVALHRTSVDNIALFYHSYFYRSFHCSGFSRHFCCSHKMC